MISADGGGGREDDDDEVAFSWNSDCAVEEQSVEVGTVDIDVVCLVSVVGRAGVVIDLNFHLVCSSHSGEVDAFRGYTLLSGQSHFQVGICWQVLVGLQSIPSVAARSGVAAEVAAILVASDYIENGADEVSVGPIEAARIACRRKVPEVDVHVSSTGGGRAEGGGKIDQELKLSHVVHPQRLRPDHRHGGIHIPSEVLNGKREVSGEIADSLAIHEDIATVLV